MPAAALRDYFAGLRVPQLDLAPGVATPLRFSDSREEHLATRRSCGLFDFSFMGCAEIAGRESLAFIDYTQTRRLDGLPPGKLAYTLLLRGDGTVLNDATVWHIEGDRYWLMTGCRADLRHLQHVAERFDVIFRDISSQHAVLAVQGPHASALVAQSLTGFVPAGTPYYGFVEGRFRAARCLIARIGYSGESGYELVIGSAHAPVLWQRLLDAGKDLDLRPCGFEAADSLRVEAGHLLFSRELAAPVAPSELALERLVDPYGRRFCGSEALRKVPGKRLVGLLPYSRGRLTLEQLMPAAGPPPSRLREGTAVVTSACFSPILHAYVALGFVSPGDHFPGTRVTLGEELYARVARLPFYDPAKRLPRVPG